MNKALSEGRIVHAHIDERGFIADRIVRNMLVDMYAKCGSLLDARRVFDQITERDVLSWTVIIKAYARHGLAEDALSLFHPMLGTGVQPNQFTFASILSVCASVRALDQEWRLRAMCLTKYVSEVSFHGRLGCRICTERVYK